MANLTVVPTEVRQDDDSRVATGTAGEAILAGQLVYLNRQQNRWFLSSAISGADAAAADGVALNSTGARQSLSVQIEGQPQLGLSAGVVLGAAYGLSATPGMLCPVADMKVWHYRTFVGFGDANGVIVLGLFHAGVFPGSVVNSHLVKRVLATRVSDNTAQVSAIIDRLGYEEVSFEFNLGTFADADATFTVLLEGGNVANMSDAAPVADGDMISQTLAVAPEVAASWDFSHDGQVRKLGYRDDSAPYRYLRLTVTPANNTGAADFAVHCILRAGTVNPVTQTAA